ncbi:response regulator transcription factor [Priestia sp. YIM B13551]|uniref:response regulator transcription factor n=1 Tax=Priestia sp. YIM B13551 TaxID=3366306 RepID=UPI00367017BD
MTKANHSLLLLEDEHEIGIVLKMILEAEGYQVNWTQTGDEAVFLASNNHFDLMILDIMLKKSSADLNPIVTNGLDVARVVSKNKSIPYMFLTSRGEGIDIMQGLDLGAEDYVKKPYDVPELLARIRAILRRTAQNQGQPMQELAFGGITLNLFTHKVVVNGNNIHLTNKQLELLHYFMKQPNQIISKENIYINVWGHEPSEIGTTNPLEVNIKRLRAAIGIDYIKTVRGKGYVLETIEAEVN